MSMLADRPKKVKYSINPRGTDWSNDNKKFGQKLLQKLGWEKGKGLGANEDGRIEIVKSSCQKDTKGLGFNATHSNNWISNQDDFNSLLSSLGDTHKTCDSEVSGILNLEEKSKSAKHRVHYPKHVKGKDLSAWTSEDMDCIFGRRKSKAKKPEPSTKVADTAVNESEQDDDENNPDAVTAAKDSEHGVTTIRTGMSVTEYFAMKMAEMKAKKASPVEEAEEPTPVESPESTVETSSLGDRLAEEGDTAVTIEEPKLDGKKRKRKKKGRDDDGLEVPETQADNNGNEEKKENVAFVVNSNDSDSKDGVKVESGDSTIKKSKKSKKRKRLPDEGENVINDSPLEDLDNNNINKEEETIDNVTVAPKKSKKRKKKTDKLPDDEKDVFIDSPLTDLDTNSNGNEEEEKVNSDVLIPKKSKKSKKKKNLSSDENDVDSDTNLEVAEVEENGSSVKDTLPLQVKKNKKKKSTYASVALSSSVEPLLNQDSCSSPVRTSKTESKDQAAVDGGSNNSSSSSKGGNQGISSEDVLKTMLQQSLASSYKPWSRKEIKDSTEAINGALRVFQNLGADMVNISGYGKQ